MKDKDKDKDKDKAYYLQKSQYYDFTYYICTLLDIYTNMELPYEKKKGYLKTLNDLYDKCINNTLTWEFIQSSLFKDTDILDVLVAYAGPIGQAVKEQIAFQYVCIMLVQTREEENGEVNVYEDDY